MFAYRSRVTGLSIHYKPIFRPINSDNHDPVSGLA